MEKIRSRAYKVLRWSERYTKTDMIYATKSGYWLMIAQVFGAVISLALSIIFARYIPKETFGVYRYILSMAGVAGAFSLSGMNSAVIRAVAQGFEGSFRQSLIEQIKWSLPQFLLCIGLGGYYFFNSNALYGFSFLIVALCAPLSTTANTYNAYLQGKKDFKTSTYYGLTSNTFYFLIMAGISILYPKTIILVLGYFLSSTVANVYFCWKTLQRQKIDQGLAGHDLPTREDDMRYGKNLSLMNIINTIAQQVDSIVIFHLLGPIQLATYSFATLIPERLRSMFGIIAVAASPKLAERKPEETRTAVRQKTLRVLILALTLTIVYIFFAPLIYKIFFPQYLDAVIYSQIFSFSLLAIASNIPMPALFAHQKERELYIMSVGLPFLKIIISIFAIIMWGIWGAIYAKILHYIVHLALSTYLASSQKKHHA